MLTRFRSFFELNVFLTRLNHLLKTFPVFILLYHSSVAIKLHSRSACPSLRSIFNTQTQKRGHTCDCLAPNLVLKNVKPLPRIRPLPNGESNVLFFVVIITGILILMKIIRRVCSYLTRSVSLKPFSTETGLI